MGLFSSASANPDASKWMIFPPIATRETAPMMRSSFMFFSMNEETSTSPLRFSFRFSDTGNSGPVMLVSND